MGRKKAQSVTEVPVPTTTPIPDTKSPGRSASTPVYNPDKAAAKARKAEEKAAAKRAEAEAAKAKKLVELTAKVDVLVGNNIGVPSTYLSDVAIMAAQEIEGDNTSGPYLDYADSEPLSTKLTEELLGMTLKDAQKEGGEFEDEYDRLYSEVGDAVEVVVREMRDILMGLLNFKSLANRPQKSARSTKRR